MASSSNLMRWGGLAAVLAGSIYAGQGFILPWFADPRVEAAFLVMLLLGVLAALAAIARLHALQGGSYGRLGVVVSLVAFIGTAFLLVGAVLEALAGPAFEPAAIFLVIGLVVASGGLSFLGVVTLVAGVLPRWCGVLIIAGNPSVASFFTDYWWILNIAWVLVGYALFRAGTRRPSSPHV